jgi:hypothetical protein
MPTSFLQRREIIASIKESKKYITSGGLIAKVSAVIYSLSKEILPVQVMAMTPISSLPFPVPYL